VRPSQLKHRLIFLWIKGVSGGIHLGRYGAEEVDRELV
jgi:hypothetical protein